MYFPTKPFSIVYVFDVALLISVPPSVEFVVFEYHLYVNVQPVGAISFVFAVYVSPYIFLPVIVTNPPIIPLPTVTEIFALASL